jgi:uracil-DNA glycosylase
MWVEMNDETLNPDAPYSLTEPGEQRRRLALLNLPHMMPLTRYLEQIKQEENAERFIPNFDPCDGGINAKGLFLLDSPDSATVKSGFVSRNNMDYASRNLCILMERAGIDRRSTLIWNLTPWRLAEIEDPITYKAFLLFERLIMLLPQLCVVVLIGDRVRSAGLKLNKIAGTQTIPTPYPFIGTFNMRDDAKEAVLKTLYRIADLLNNQ